VSFFIYGSFNSAEAECSNGLINYIAMSNIFKDSALAEFFKYQPIVSTMGIINVNHNSLRVT